jgi:hypothetical protein
MRQHSSFLLVLLVSTPLFAKGPTSDQLKAVKTAEVLGTAIYAQDHAASLASDAFLAAIKPDRRTDIAGWIVRDEKESKLVKFVGKRDGTYFGLYQLHVDRDQVSPVALIDPPRELDGLELGMFMARQVALKEMPHACSTPYNTVVLPGGLANFDGWLVYLLAASSDSNAVPVGGHFRARVTPDGASLISIEPLSKSCLTLARTSEKGATAALYMTHLLTDTPIETHVFLNLLYGVDFYVGTETSVWGISKGSIRYVGRNKNAK